jgi:hypothetical protein
MPTILLEESHAYQPPVPGAGARSVKAHVRPTIASVAARLTVELSRMVEASPQRVFEAMTDPEQVAEWWGPEGRLDRHPRSPSRPSRIGLSGRATDHSAGWPIGFMS